MSDEGATAGKGPTRWIGTRGAFAMAAVWALAAAGAFWLGDGAQARFLDLPLSAYLAGQGAIMSMAVLAFGVLSADRDEDRYEDRRED